MNGSQSAPSSLPAVMTWTGVAAVLCRWCASLFQGGTTDDAAGNYFLSNSKTAKHEQIVFLIRIANRVEAFVGLPYFYLESVDSDRDSLTLMRTDACLLEQIKWNLYIWSGLIAGNLALIVPGSNQSWIQEVFPLCHCNQTFPLLAKRR